MIFDKEFLLETLGDEEFTYLEENGGKGFAMTDNINGYYIGCYGQHEDTFDNYCNWVGSTNREELLEYLQFNIQLPY